MRFNWFISKYWFWLVLCLGVIAFLPCRLDRSHKTLIVLDYYGLRLPGWQTLLIVHASFAAALAFGFTLPECAKRRQEAGLGHQWSIRELLGVTAAMAFAWAPLRSIGAPWQAFAAMAILFAGYAAARVVAIIWTRPNGRDARQSLD